MTVDLLHKEYNVNAHYFQAMMHLVIFHNVKVFLSEFVFAYIHLSIYMYMYNNFLIYS